MGDTDLTLSRQSGESTFLWPVCPQFRLDPAVGKALGKSCQMVRIQAESFICMPIVFLETLGVTARIWQSVCHSKFRHLKRHIQQILQSVSELNSPCQF